jgi:hypothetical protein
MRAIVIPANPELPIEERQIDNTLEAKQAIVGGLICVLDPFDQPDLTGYVNEDRNDGAGIALPRNARATLFCAEILFADDCVCGDYLICGFNPRAGDHVDVRDDVTVAMIERRIESMHTNHPRTPTVAEFAAAHPHAIVVDATADAPLDPL